MWSGIQTTSIRPSPYHLLSSESADAEGKHAEILREDQGFLHRTWRSLSQLNRFLLVALLCVCVGEGIAIVKLYSKRTEETWPASPVPPASWVSRTFTRDPIMTNLRTSEEVEVAWQNYETTAFVHIQNPARYALSPNANVMAGTENIYMLSAHHQLHCLKKLHLAFVSMMYNATETEKLGATHAEHCFEYLRHGILCAGDSTLEGPDRGGKTLTGYGVVHRCRAWDEPGGLDTWRKDHAPAVHAGRKGAE